MPPELEHISAEMTTHATDIMTACSFQDLTGQRITKVVKTLQQIDQGTVARSYPLPVQVVQFGQDPAVQFAQAALVQRTAHRRPVKVPDRRSSKRFFKVSLSRSRHTRRAACCPASGDRTGTAP